MDHGCLSLKEGEPRDRIIGLCHGLSRTYYLYDVGISLVFLDRRIELFYLELVQNVGLLVSLVVIHGQIIRRWNKYTFGSSLFRFSFWRCCGGGSDDTGSSHARGYV